jgi:hypothetical protein
LLFSVDLSLRFDGELGAGQLLVGPQGFDGGANFGAFHRYRGVGLQFGALDLGARRSAAIVSDRATV